MAHVPRPGFEPRAHGVKVRCTASRAREAKWLRGHELNVDRRAYETHGVSRHPHWLRIEGSNLGLPVQSRTSVPLDQSASKLPGQGSNLGLFG